MGVSSKLSVAFVTVVLVMVICHAGISLFLEFLDSQNQARKTLSDTNSFLMQTLEDISSTNQDMASNLAKHDPAFSSAFQARDRDAVGKDIKSLIDRTGFPGNITVLDDRGVVFYESDAPRQFGYSVRDRCPPIDSVISSGHPYKGPAAFSQTNEIYASGMVPLPGVTGIITVNQPLNSDFLSGLTAQIASNQNHLNNVDFALYSSADGKIVATTNGLRRTDGGYISRINSQGAKALPYPNPVDNLLMLCGVKGVPFPTTEVNGRLWEAIPQSQGKDNVVGVLLLSTPIPSVLDKTKVILIADFLSAAIAIFIGLLFAFTIGGKTTHSVQFLIQRTKDLAAHKATLAPLDSLEGQFLELAELFDTTVASMRASVQNLKTQLLKHEAEANEKTQYAEVSHSQVDALNKQITTQTKQVSELGRQLNATTQQVLQFKQKLNLITQISSEGLLFLDQWGGIVSTNQAFLKWLDATEPEIAGGFVFNFVKKPGEPVGASQYPMLAQTSGPPVDLVAQFFPEGVIYNVKKNTACEVLIYLQPLLGDDNSVQGFLMQLRDKALLSEIQQLRQDILHMLSEAIGAPLASAEATWTSVLNDARQSQNMPPALGQTLAQLHNHYAQMMGVVDNLLLMYGGSKPSPMITKEPVVITRLIGECLQEVAPVAQEAKIHLDYKTVTGLPTVNTDKVTFRNVVIELLTKMISITAAGGRIRVENKLKDREVRMSITSSGPPLSQEEILDMFVGFVQDKHAEETYSSRLSMYLTRNNVERLGGRIWCAADEEGKTTINFTIAV